MGTLTMEDTISVRLACPTLKGVIIILQILIFKFLLYSHYKHIDLEHAIASSIILILLPLVDMIRDTVPPDVFPTFPSPEVLSLAVTERVDLLNCRLGKVASHLNIDPQNF